MKNKVKQVSFYEQQHGSVTQQINTDSGRETSLPTCQYKSISDLETYERYPKAIEIKDGNDRRHMVDPPEDDHIALVCCETSVGPLAIAVHSNWAPIGTSSSSSVIFFNTKLLVIR